MYFLRDHLELEQVKISVWEGWQWREKRAVSHLSSPVVTWESPGIMTVTCSLHGMHPLFSQMSDVLKHDNIVDLHNLASLLLQRLPIVLVVVLKEKWWLKTLLLYFQLGTWFRQWPRTAVPAPWCDLGGCACWYQHPSYNSVWKPPWTTSVISLERASR